MTVLDKNAQAMTLVIGPQSVGSKLFFFFFFHSLLVRPCFRYGGVYTILIQERVYREIGHDGKVAPQIL